MEPVAVRSSLRTHCHRGKLTMAIFVGWVDRSPADPAMKHRCLKPEERRSARLSHRAGAELDHGNIVSEQAVA